MSEQGGTCPRCQTPYEAGQGYCLECGLRLEGGKAGPPPEHHVAPPAPPSKPNRTWIWAALGGLVVAAAGAAVAIAVSGNGGSSTLTMTTTVPQIVVTLTPATDTGAQPPQPTTTVAVTTVATVPTTPVDTATATTGKPTLIVWPGKTAYTVVFDSLPSPGGHTEALAQANKALAKDLPQVGVLDSGDFPSLNPGYYVVFSGIYETLLEAETGARNARFQGFGTAYPRQIKR